MNFIEVAPADFGLLRSCAAELDFRGEIRVQQGRAAVQSGANLKRGDSRSAAQISASQVHAIQFHSAQNRAGQIRSPQIRLLQIGVKQDGALQIRAGQIRFSKFCRRQIRLLEICKRKHRVFESGVSHVRARAFRKFTA